MAQSFVRVTAEHIAQICPTAPARVINELFSDDAESPEIINSILRRTGIVSHQAIATFLSLVIYNSFGLREFAAPASQSPLSPASWLYSQATRWCDLKLSDEMDGQPSSYEYAFDAMRTSPDGTMPGWGTANMASRFDLYEKALAAFGVKSCEDGPGDDDD